MESDKSVDWEDNQDNLDSSTTDSIKEDDLQQGIKTIEDCERIGKLKKEAKERQEALKEKFPDDKKSSGISVDVTDSSTFIEYDKIEKCHFRVSPYANNILETLMIENNTSMINIGTIISASTLEPIKELLEQRYEQFKAIILPDKQANNSVGRVCLKQSTLIIPMDIEDSISVTLFLSSHDTTLVKKYSDIWKCSPSYVMEIRIYLYCLNSKYFNESTKKYCKSRIDSFIKLLDDYIESNNDVSNDQLISFYSILSKMERNSKYKTKSGNRFKGYFENIIGSNKSIEVSFKVKDNNELDSYKEKRKKQDKRKSHNGAGTGIFKK